MHAILVNAMFYEAVAISDCIKTASPPPETSHIIILTFEAVTLDGVYYNRHFALNGINKIVRNVCLSAFLNNDEEHEISVTPNVDLFSGQFALNGAEPIAVV